MLTHQVSEMPRQSGPDLQSSILETIGMNWHESAVLASCEHYATQLETLPREPWIEALIAFYSDPHAPWQIHELAPLAQPPGYSSAVNEMTLGLGSSKSSAAGLVIGLEAAYETPETAQPGKAKPGTAQQTKISYLVEGCALSALWQRNVDIATIAAMARGAAAPLAWPPQLPDWGVQPHQFFRNPAHHYPLAGGHTWRVLARVLSDGALDQLFGQYYVLELSHIPKKKNKGKKVSAPRLAFLRTLVRDFARDNPKGKLWFHGAGRPDAVLRPQRRPETMVSASRASRVLMNEFLGDGAAPDPAYIGEVQDKKGKIGRFERYDHDGRSVIFSYHASGRTRVGGNYWAELSKMF